MNRGELRSEFQSDFAPQEVYFNEEFTEHRQKQNARKELNKVQPYNSREHFLQGFRGVEELYRTPFAEKAGVKDRISRVMSVGVQRMSEADANSRAEAIPVDEMIDLLREAADYPNMPDEDRQKYREQATQLENSSQSYFDIYHPKADGGLHDAEHPELTSEQSEQQQAITEREAYYISLPENRAWRESLVEKYPQYAEPSSQNDYGLAMEAMRTRRELVYRPEKAKKNKAAKSAPAADVAPDAAVENSVAPVAPVEAAPAPTSKPETQTAPDTVIHAPEKITESKQVRETLEALQEQFNISAEFIGDKKVSPQIKEQALDNLGRLAKAMPYFTQRDWGRAPIKLFSGQYIEPEDSKRIGSKWIFMGTKYLAEAQGTDEKLFNYLRRRVQELSLETPDNQQLYAQYPHIKFEGVRTKDGKRAPIVKGILEALETKGINLEDINKVEVTGGYTEPSDIKHHKLRLKDSISPEDNVDIIWKAYQRANQASQRTPDAPAAFQVNEPKPREIKSEQAEPEQTESERLAEQLNEANKIVRKVLYDLPQHKKMDEQYDKIYQAIEKWMAQDDHSFRIEPSNRRKTVERYDNDGKDLVFEVNKDDAEYFEDWYTVEDEDGDPTYADVPFSMSLNEYIEQGEIEPVYAKKLMDKARFLVERYGQPDQVAQIEKIDYTG